MLDKEQQAKRWAMGRRARVVAWFVLVVSLMIGSWQWGYGQSSRSLARKRTQIQKQTQQAKRRLQEIKDRQAQTTGQLQQIRGEMQRVTNGVQAATNRWNLAKQKEEEARKGYEDAAARYEAQKEAFQERVADLYMEGDTTYLEVLLEAKDFYDVVNRAYLCQKLVEADLRMFGTIKAEKERLLEARESWNHSAIEAQDSQQRLTEQKAALGVMQRRQQEVLASTLQERKRAEEDLAILQEASRQVEAMYRSMMQTSAGRQRLKSRWAGGYLVPVSGNVTSGFGYRHHPILGGVRMHTGVDIACPVGTAIVASAGGVVIYSGWMRGYGKTVWIDHGGGMSTLYAHCSSLLVGEGAEVRQGQVIARVGMTGLTNGPHLHWEKRINGTPVNPL